ncbi:hypothetical protein F4781DRAFT_429615 [Annulohypoxylon bovei var. microspora]|nr:hypothetical protein F4781DRAFT_429615 [Annulohypoxylon bovei var. microspora]
MASRSGPQPILSGMPNELILEIISDKQISRQDLKNLRLVCHAFDQPVASILFRYITISRLREDRDAFEEIIARKHLAKHVRQIVWQELNLEALDVESFSITRLMKAAVEDTDLFWIPKARGSEMPSRSVRYSMATFLTRLAVAIERMPKLTAIRSCPMPYDRLFYYRGYPLQADLYRHQEKLSFQTGNHGFFNFLMPVMDQLNSKITSLHLADESTNSRSFIVNLKPSNSQAFEALTSIDLCFAQGDKLATVPPDGLVSCLSAARNLKHLSLCFERTGRPKPIIEVIFVGCHWPHLHTLTLMNVTWVEPPILALFCNKHATSLRHLDLVVCHIRPVHLRTIRNSAKLQLESIRMVGSPAAKAYFFHQKNILSYFNHKPRVPPDNIKYEVPPLFKNYISTERSIYDHHGWRMAGYYDTHEIGRCKRLCDEAEEVNDTSSEDADYSSDSSSDSDDSDGRDSETYDEGSSSEESMMTVGRQRRGLMIVLSYRQTNNK